MAIDTSGPQTRRETVSPERLYRRWEEGNWSATALDFTTDREHWLERFSEQQRKAALWNYSLFLVGEESVARTLTPIMDSAEGYPEKIFLATQIVDEARHHIFFDRFVREVAGVGSDTASTLAGVEEQLTWGFTQIFAELDRVTDDLRRHPKDRALLAQAVALYHVVIEGMLAIPSQHFIQRYIEKMDLMPAFNRGIDLVSRDESRHVAFGVKFLGDLVQSSGECRAAALELWDRVLPWAAGVFSPPNMDNSYAECFDFTIPEILSFGIRSFETKVKRVGLQPTEIPLLSLEPALGPTDERGEQIWMLVRDKVIGTDEDPAVSAETLERIFSAATQIVDVETARSLGGPIQWEFADAEPWHLGLNGQGLEAARGRVEDPGLVLECSAGDWAKLALRQTDPRLAILSRKLRVHGPWSNKTKLPRLFGERLVRRRT